jgi:predicted DNA-binding transcriptional regulator AlpA
MSDDTPILTLSRSKLAVALDISESSVDEFVRRGVLPQPVRFSTGCVRWRLEDVKTALAKLANGADHGDPFLAGIRNAAKGTTEGRRGAA